MGWNNRVFPNVGMPHVLAELQGKPVVGCKAMPVREGNTIKRDSLTGDPVTDEQCDVLVVEEGTGTQTEEEYDTTVRNLVAFLAYSADPSSSSVTASVFMFFSTWRCCSSSLTWSSVSTGKTCTDPVVLRNLARALRGACSFLGYTTPLLAAAGKVGRPM